MRDKRSFRDGKGVSLRVQTEGAPGKPAYKGTERLFFLLWQKSPYMWYTDREQKYKNMFWTDCEQTSCYFTEGRVRHCGNKGKTAAAEGIRM